MNFVEPIRDHKKIAQIKNLLRGQGQYRDLLLFVVGINTALRISDLLQLRLGHFMDEKGHLRNRFWIKEQKRGECKLTSTPSGGGGESRQGVEKGGDAEGGVGGQYRTLLGAVGGKGQSCTEPG
jgi:hypothetical protein